MEKMEYLAKEIIEEFEKNYPIPTSVSEWEDNAEEILLYLAAKKYLKRYGKNGKNGIFSKRNHRRI